MQKSYYKLSDLSKKWIESLPKTINDNGCWIPLSKPMKDGYGQIQIEGFNYTLHRLVIAIYHNINYHNQSWTSRHSKGCDRQCFYIEHLKLGTISDNVKDEVEHGTHRNSRKEVCPKCGGPYRGYVLKTGLEKGKMGRYCPACKRARRRVNDS